MNAARKAEKSTLNNTDDLVRYVLNSVDNPRPTDALKPIKTILKKMGFTIGAQDKKDLTFPVSYQPVKIKGDGRGTSGSEYKPATIYDMLRSYRASIKSLNLKNHKLGGKHCPIEAFKKDKGERIESLGHGELLNELDASNDMPSIRLAIKKIKHACRSGDIQTALKKLHVENQAYYWVDACMYEVGVMVREQSAKAYDKARNNRILINPDFITSWAEKVLSDKHSSVEALVIALMAVTGRRTSEVLKTASFTKTKDSNTVMFDGQLKQKDREALGFGAGTYVIPVLVDSGLVISGLKRLRKNTANHTVKYMADNGEWVEALLLDPALRFDVRHTEGVNDTFNQGITAAAKKLLNSPDARPYLLRAAYTTIAISKGFQKPGEDDSAFRKRVLGHANYQSEGNYQKFALSTEVDSIAPEKTTEKVDENKASETLALLTSKDDEIYGNTRAKGMHKLQALAKKLAEAGELEISQIDSTWARRQIIDGKKVGAATVKQWLGILKE